MCDNGKSLWRIIPRHSLSFWRQWEHIYTQAATQPHVWNGRDFPSLFHLPTLYFGGMIIIVEEISGRTPLCEFRTRFIVCWSFIWKDPLLTLHWRQRLGFHFLVYLSHGNLVYDSFLILGNSSSQLWIHRSEKYFWIYNFWEEISRKFFHFMQRRRSK